MPIKARRQQNGRTENAVGQGRCQPVKQTDVRRDLRLLRQRDREAEAPAQPKVRQQEAEQKQDGNAQPSPRQELRGARDGGDRRGLRLRRMYDRPYRCGGKTAVRLRQRNLHARGDKHGNQQPQGGDHPQHEKNAPMHLALQQQTQQCDRQDHSRTDQAHPQKRHSAAASSSLS